MTAYSMVPPQGPPPGSPRARRDRQLKLTVPVSLFFVGGFWAIVLLSCAAGLTGATRFFYTPLAFVIGAFLFVRFPAAYLVHLWWIWFLTPFVRRVVDFKSGWTEFSPIMLAPYVVSLLMLVTVIRFLPRLSQRDMFPFVPILVALSLAYPIGVMNAGFSPASFDVLNWVLPVVMGIHIAFSWRNYEKLKVSTEQAFLMGAAVLGIYGIYQFFFLAPWDAFWMQVVQMESIGRPAPLEVRIFGTLNSPGPYANMLAVSLLIVLGARGRLPFLAGIPAIVALLLSLVRAAWVGFGAGLFIMLAKMDMSRRAKLIAAVVLTVVLSLPLLSVEEVSKTVTTRIESMIGDKAQDDQSFKDRIHFFQTFVEDALSNPVGQGIGATGVATKISNNGKMGELGVIDSGLLEVPFVLGWLGGALYLSGVALLVTATFKRRWSRQDGFVTVAESVALSILVQMVFTNMLTGFIGTLFWSFIGFSIAAERHWASQSSTARSSSRGASAP
ncbi:O-antigen ligase family protein (plasmid) [Skermanella rosea]|uniref:O-antigen ligase family protein n=1 Tax=Skermanella rosea TaxID=1817965 RepID=UPI001933B561|nr:O-antigen ligase family protein [Skermanella rosea]UEM06861.1 O-antigen ligase family protein [Skermanella rosea]